jgi:CBS domain-containing protein
MLAVKGGTAMSTTVSDVMTRRVVALRADAGFKEIVAALRHYRVSACPVIDDSGRVIGLVSEADLLYKQTDPQLPAGLIRLDWRLHEQTKATAVTAAELMTAPPVVVHPSAAVTEAATIMQDLQVKRLPVVAADGRLVGIVTRSDVLSVFERPDADIWDQVTKVILDAEYGLDPDCFDVTVRSGVVTLSGQIDRRDTALHVLASVRHAEGVVGIRDRLSYPDELRPASPPRVSRDRRATP